MELSELKMQASSMRKSNNYPEAEKLYKQLWDNHKEQMDDWDIWGYAFSLRKLGRVREAYEVCKYGYDKNKNFIQIISVMSWCLFDLYIKTNNEEIEKNELDFFKAANFIVNKTKQQEYSPYEITVFKVIDYLNSRNNVNYKNINEWLDKLSPGLLSDRAFKFVDNTGVEREKESNKEKWYALKSKCLGRIGEYEQCIKICKEALSIFKEFHYNNEIWMKRRIAVSTGLLGNIPIAINQLEEILRYKREWFIQVDIAKFYYEMKNTEKAIEYAIEALLNAGDIDKKIEVLVLFSKILKETGKVNEAERHLLLVKKIREEKEWKLNNEFIKMLEDFGVNDTEESSSTIYTDLKKGWLNRKLSSLPRGIGVIKNLLPEGRKGFIRGEDGVDYFFNIRSFRGNRNSIKQGVKVEYYIQTSFDISKNRESKEAINIQIVS